MAKFVFYVSTGYVGADKQEVVDVDIDGLTEEEIEREVQNAYDSWLGNNAELSWWPATEEDEED